MSARALFNLFRETWAEWSQDKVPRLGAALAYYTVFSLAPLLIIAIAIAGMVFGQEAAKGQIVWQIRGLVGQQGAELIQTIIENASLPSTSVPATLIGVVVLLVGALGAFSQ
ncbi:MAG: YihY/virulence factor BrkB family protein, partial [Anaerolineales bacterium]